MTAAPRPGGRSVDAVMLSIVIIWGANFSVIKLCYEYFHPLAFNAIRFIITTLTMCALMRARGESFRIEPGDRSLMIALGLLANFAYQFLFVMGLAYTKAGNGGLLMSLTPIFAYVIGVLWGTEQFNRWVLGGIVLSFAGVISIILLGGTELSFGPTWRGDLLLFASAICWGAYSALSARLLPRYGSIRMTTIAMLIGSSVLLPASLPWLLTQDWSGVTPAAWAGLFFSAELALVYAYFAWSYSISRVGVARTAVFSNLTPVIALLTAWVMLGEQPVPAQLGGVALILAGVFTVRRWGARADTREQAA